MRDSLILGLESLLLWGGHWMPWRVAPFLVNERGDLYRLFAYGYGCACIVVGFVLWAYAQAQDMPLVSVWAAVWFLIRDVMAAGVGTILPRIVKALLEYQALRGDVADYEQAIRD